MAELSSLGALGVGLAFAHFAMPVLYYLVAVKRWLRRPWSVNVDESYKPMLTVIVPTYNEAELIERKLDNIYMQDYPKSLLEVIVVDSASTDGTPEKAIKWANRHRDLKVKVIVEEERRGKAHALNTALKHARGELIAITDVDAWWPNSDTLSKALAWLADERVGAVSCVKLPAGEGLAGVERGYRDYYNLLRIAESKAWSTPIFHGELAVFRRSLLDRLGGFPTNVGADDSHTATLIALNGYRAIIPGDAVCVEAVPRRGEYHRWKIRRAQHLLQHFIASLRLIRRSPAPPIFKRILLFEAYLHLLNPWLLPPAAILLGAAAAAGHAVSLALLLAGLALLAYRPYRTWVLSQAYLIVAAVRNLYTKDIVWEKQSKSA